LRRDKSEQMWIKANGNPPFEFTTLLLEGAPLCRPRGA